MSGFFFQDLDRKWLKKQIIPLLVIAAFITFLALLYLGSSPLERLAASYSGRQFTPFQRILTEFRVVIFYISLVIFPHPARLNLDHDFTISTGFLSPVSTIISACILLIMLSVSFAAARKHRVITFCIIWFLGNLIIESSFIGLEIIFEHRTYLPSMLLILLFVIIVDPLVGQPRLRIAFLCAVVLFFSAWSFQRNLVWHDKISLWGDSVAKSPAKARPHNNLGVALKDAGRLDEAAAQFMRTIELDPEFTEAYNNLGNTYIQKGKYEMGANYLKKALEISPNNPQIHVNLGNSLVKRWELEEALFHFGEALRLDPDDSEARLNFFSTRRLLESKKMRDWKK